MTTALETFTQAVASLRAAGNLADELTSTVVLADMWLAAGRPTEARRLLQGALDLAAVRAEAAPRGTADLHVALSEIELEAGHLDRANRHLEHAAAADKRVAMGENRFRLFVAMAKVAAAERDLPRAIDHLDRAERLYQPGFVPEVRPIPAMRARMWIVQGKLTEAAEWAHAVAVTATDDVVHLREFELLTLVRLLIAQHREQQDNESADQAVSLLARLHNLAESSGRRRSVVETHLLSALTLDRQGQRYKAVESLQRAWADAAEPDAYGRLFLDEGAPMLELLHGAVRQEVSAERAQRLLDLAASAGHGSMEAAPEHERSSLPGPLVDPLSDRELHVLRLLAGDLSGPEIASELFVSLNTFRSHTKRIFTKLDVTTRRGAVSRGRDAGLL